MSARSESIGEPARSARGRRGRSSTVPFSPADLPCVGRNEELKQVLQGLKAAEAGKGSVWLFTGPGGIGKSRLLRRAGELAAQRGFQVRFGYGLEGSSTPLLPFRQILAGNRSLSPSGGGQIRGRRVRPATVDPRRRGAAALPEASESVDMTILGVIGELERASRDRPQLVILDDFESADAESLRCLRLLARTGRVHPIVLLVAARVDLESPKEGRVERALIELRRGGLVQWRELLPLDEEGRLRLAAHILGRPEDDLQESDEIRELIRSAGGNPYFIIELVLSWADRRSAGPLPPRDAAEAEGPGRGPRSELGGVPPTVRPVILARLRRLSRREGAIVGLAARMGLVFETEALSAATRRPVSEVDAELSRLAKEGWPIMALPARRRAYAFDHQLLRSIILESTEFMPSRAALRRLVRWWSHHRPADPLTEARLRNLVQDRAGAVDCLGRALGRLLEHGAVQSIPDLLRWGRNELVGGEVGSERMVALTVDTAARLRELWEFDTVDQVLADIPLDQLREPVRWRVDCWRVESMMIHNLEKAGARLRLLGQEARSGSRGPPEETRPMLVYLRALNSWYWSKPGDAHRRLARAARTLDDGHHDFERYRLLLYDGVILSNQARWAAARRVTSKARGIIARRARAGSPLEEKLRHLESHLAFCQGYPEEALAGVRSRANDCHRSGNVGLEGHALLQLATFEYSLRLTEAARADLDRVDDLSAKLGVPALLAGGRLLRGWSWIVDGDWAEARKALRSTLSLGEEVDWPDLRSAASVGLALVKAELGDPQGGLESLPVAVPGPGLSVAYLTEYYCARGRILELCSDLTGARAAFLSAVREARNSRAPLPDLFEGYSQLARWEHRHGTPRGARRAQKQLDGTPARWRNYLKAPWKGIGFAGGRTPVRAPLRGPLGPAPTAEEGPLRLAHRILDFLGRPSPSRETTSSVPGSQGFTEAQLAAGLGVSRDRFSRALRRLQEDGWVEREVDRPRGANRRVFVYRLTARGARAAGRMPP
ncbi:MAG: AAA family ATPase [Thermoplasmata archaeon]